MASSRLKATRINGIQTQEAILDAAARCYCTYGYGGVSISEIARAAKMSKPKLLYHFADTDRILVELAKIWSESGRQVTVEFLASQNLATAEDRVLAMADAMFEWIMKKPQIAKLTPTLLQAVRANGSVRKIVQETLDTGAARVAAVLSNSTQQPRLSEEELRKKSRAIHSIMVGGALYVISMDAWESFALYQSTVRDGIRFLLTSGNGVPQ